MPYKEHKESHQPDHQVWLRPQEKALLGGEIGVYDARFIIILNELEKEGHITSWKRCPDWSDDNISGKDYWVKIDDFEVPFQITGNRDAAKVRKAKHPEIPVIYFYNRSAIKAGKVARGFKSPEITKQEILEKSKFYIRRYR